MAAQTIVYAPLNNFAAVVASDLSEMTADFRSHEQALNVYRRVVNAEQIRTAIDLQAVTIRHW